MNRWLGRARRYATRRRDLALITASGLFDEAWYLEHNPDVARAQIQPVFHFLQYGGAEGRSPGPKFSSSWYLKSYPDVKRTGVNPLVHYLRYGRHEGRSPNPESIDVASKSPRIVVADVLKVRKRLGAGPSSDRAVGLRKRLSLEPLMLRGSGDRRYALLTYATRNLGDDIQSLAALQFLPHVDALVDRDQIGEFQSSAEHRILMNGWFMGRRSWPPPESLRPFYVSFHLGNFAYRDHENPSSWLLSEASLDHLRKFQPVGCRDLRTVQLLEANGVAGYFSGCLTLTLPPAATTHSREEILIVDTAIHPNELYRSVPPKLSGKVSVITHTTNESYSPELRFQLAAGLLHRYSRAHLVVTSKLHCLLPCLAFGTPVIFIPPAYDLGRFLGYDGFCHVVSADQTKLGMAIPWDRPDPNPTNHLPFARQLRSSVEAFVGAASAESASA